MNACLPRCEPVTEADVSDFDGKVAKLRQQCLEHKFETIQPAEKYFDEVHLRYFLRLKLFSIPYALETWAEWVEWRYRIGADEITDEEIADEVSSGLAEWRGKDKAGRLCLVVTPRLLNPRGRKGNHKTFQKFLIRIIEDGLRKADAADVHEVCILYDRTGLTFEHIDPILQQFSKPTISALKHFYSARLGALYVLHLNWWFQLFFTWLVRPILSAGGAENKFTVFNTPEELLDVFDEEQLFLTKYVDFLFVHSIFNYVPFYITLHFCCVVNRPESTDKGADEGNAAVEKASAPPASAEGTVSINR